MAHTDRREAHNAKRGLTAWQARASGNHLSAANDEPEPGAEPEVIRAYAVGECSNVDGYPTGFWDVTEDTRTNGVFRTRRVPGTRARSAGAAMALYRKAVQS